MALSLRLARTATAALIVVAVVVQFFTPDDPWAVGANFFSFFTIQSNLMAAVVLIVLVVRGKRPRSETLDLVRGAATLYLLITGIVFALLLSNLPEDLQLTRPWVDTALHQIAPLVLVLDWLIDPPRRSIPLRAAVLWLGYPLAYVAYTLIRGSIVHWYPYPFLDVDEHGYVAVLAGSVGLALGFALAAIAVARTGNWLGRRRWPSLAAGAAVLLLCSSGAALAATPTTGTSPGNVYFTAGEQFQTVKRDLPASGRRLPTAIRHLLAGPTRAEQDRGIGSAIPDGTKLLSESFDAQSGVASIRFDARFIYTRKVVRTRADAIEEYRGRAGEVVFTATSFPEVKAVRISVPGHAPVTLRRSDFAKPSKAPKPQTTPKPPNRKQADIRTVQRQLATLRYLPSGTVNGSYDDRTKQAILAFQAWNGLDRDGIAGPKTAARLSTAAVPKPRTKLSGRYVEIDRSRGVVLLVLDGVVQRAIHTSTGRGGDSTDLGTPPGNYKIYRKERNSWSVPYRVWLPYAAYWDRGWALHGYKDVPAHPASAGCARLPLSEAAGVYDFVRNGTPVRVY